MTQAELIDISGTDGLDFFSFGPALNTVKRYVRGDPEEVGIAFAHCQVHKSSPPRSPGGNVCVFGDRSSQTTVVNLGDSHGLMYAPGLIALARKRHWGLVSLTPSGCPVAGVDYEAGCDAWRKNVIDRVATEHPAFVIVSDDRLYELAVNGGPVSLQDWAAALWKDGRARAAAQAYSGSAVPSSQEFESILKQAVEEETVGAWRE